MRPVSETLQGYARGMAGGLLFSIAPLFTMELWWQGYVTPPLRLLATSAIMLVVLLAYAHYVGVHDGKSLKDNALEVFQVVALATVISVVVLKLAGQLPPEASLYEKLTKVVGEGTAVAIGVAVGSTQLGEDPDEKKGGKGAEQREKGRIPHELAFAVLGAILLAAGLAPAVEIIEVASVAPAWAVLSIAALSFTLGLLVVNYSKFKGSASRDEDIFAGGPLGDGVVTYAVGLATAAGMLWVTGGLDYGVTLGLYQVVFLATATTLGAAAGRMLL